MFVVNTSLEQGKVFVLEEDCEDDEIVAVLFLGEIKVDLSAEISLIYTNQGKRNRGKFSVVPLLVV